MRDLFPLPNSNEVDINRLASLFDQYTSSYKFLWFKAILDVIKIHNINIIDMNDILFGMLQEAYYPLIVFHLDFGSGDGMRKIFEQNSILKEKKSLFTGLGKEKVRHILEKGIANDMKRYVPTRLLVPFFREHLRGCKESVKDERIRELTNIHFEEERTLYRFSVKDQIEIHPEWFKYFKKNMAVIEGWYFYKWISFLQSRNPNVPAIPYKIMNQERTSLKLQRGFWLEAAKNRPMVCIYSDSLLKEDEMELDHFLPWSFVAHDQLWNLIPVSKMLNIQKSDKIPHPRFIEKLAERHFQALEDTRQVFKTKQWNDLAACYQGDLRINLDGPIRLDAVQDAYQNTLSALMNLAINTGFEGNWEPAGLSIRHG
ncbi:MAG: hypothetical protein CVU53_03840 [Deltaproteobacteria bacterium HGW-Deltaproteobacteria-11]|nr:MAG: hypothetical protein CVU53_03840 [Deltaproteobacteria bacterium HGW-Deltaproteobacteria-11]